MQLSRRSVIPFLGAWSRSLCATGGTRMRRLRSEDYRRIKMAPKQLSLPTWGGRRAGAGRKASGLVVEAHRERPVSPSRHPVHVTLRTLAGVQTLRGPVAFGAILAALAAASDHLGMRIVHFSVQSNHIHLLMEAEDEEALSRAMRGFTIRLARALHDELGTSGQIFPERYHLRVLKTPLQVKRAVAYVVNNLVRHRGSLPVQDGKPQVDACSSAVYCKVYRCPVAKPLPRPGPPPVAPPQTWLLREGWWRQHDYISPDDIGARHKLST